MKSKVSWIIGGIIAFLLFAIAYMPAVHVIGRIALPSNVAVSGVSGTLFSGKAQTVVVNGLPINNVKWELSPLHMLIGKIKLNLKQVIFAIKTTLHLKGLLPRGFSARTV